ncbi:uncharacterized protein LOC123552816 isoform X2 [Mercenaria mercenaria]|uniref:uncharacterized protein LOC123552816 isoform X2 n=1 Tax=Mercenaria mercenaria TaxID=6596 RepID=UPI00234F7935|nr:uncharacterized protein LOC123552816 isoform X2 [Mercenaria mercenaria]
MDRGRNLEALAEEDDEEEMEEEHRRDSDSDSSTSDDDAPDEGTKRGEPNKFDILCDGVNNSMALVHTAMEELLEMKDEMLRHQLPPTLLIKLATTTGKVFRSVSDLNMPVNELLRLVRVYSTPWEEKSAALKKLHEDYEAKQRQLNIAIKRLQLVDAHSKRIAREKRVMNWEKLFAKVMSNKGHGRRWKFLIETIKQKAKLGLEHVQEFTRQLDESDEEEEDDMPTIQFKHGGESPSASDKVSKRKASIMKSTPTSKSVSEAETEGDEEDGGGAEKAESESVAGSEVEKEVPSIKIESGAQEEEEEEEEGEELEEEEEEKDADAQAAETAKKVRFAEEMQVTVPKKETKDAEVSTQDPEYDHFMFVRLYSPIGMTQTDIKCSLTFGKQFFKTKRLDNEADADKDKKVEPKLSDIKKRRYEETMFSLPDPIPEGIWMKNRDALPTAPPNFQISIHTGPTDTMTAMATIELADLKEINLKEVILPGPQGDDDVPKTPEPPEEDDLDSLSSEIDIPLPGDEKKTEPPQEDRVHDVEPMMYPLYSLDGSSAVHKPCGSLPLIIYWGKRVRPMTFNRQIGTHGVTELVFELTGIDLEMTSKADLHKETNDRGTSVINFAPDVQDRALSALRLTPEVEPPNPPTSPEHEEIQEEVITDIKEEMIAKVEYDKVVEKHSKDMLFLQEEYEKRLQSLIENLQQMEKNQQLHQQQILKQQQQLTDQQKLLTQRRQASPGLSPQATLAPPATPKKSAESSDVSKPVIHAPMPPQKPRTKGPRKKPTPVQKSWDGVPSEFLDRLAYFEDESYRHKIELIEKTRKEIQDDIEKKLAGQHKLSRRDQEMFEALNDVSLPALFMPFQRGSVFNPRAHQYFHPTGSTELRLTQPPSVFQLPPLSKNSSSILNLFELSKNFNSRNQGWLMDRYIQQQEPVKNVHGMIPQTTMPTSQMRSPSAPYTPQPTYDIPPTREEEYRQRTMEAEAEC